MLSAPVLSDSDYLLQYFLVGVRLMLSFYLALIGENDKVIRYLCPHQRRKHPRNMALPF